MVILNYPPKVSSGRVELYLLGGLTIPNEGVPVWIGLGLQVPLPHLVKQVVEGLKVLVVVPVVVADDDRLHLAEAEALAVEVVDEVVPRVDDDPLPAPLQEVATPRQVR